MEREIAGCYDCAQPCEKGMLQKAKPKGFTAFVKRFGKKALLDCLARNEQNGVVYHRVGITGDYDGIEDVEALMDFIQTGKR